MVMSGLDYIIMDFSDFHPLLIGDTDTGLAKGAVEFPLTDNEYLIRSTNCECT